MIPSLSTAYGKIEIFKQFENCPSGKNEHTKACRLILVYFGSLRSCLRQTYGIVTDIYSMKLWASGLSNHERETGAEV